MKIMKLSPYFVLLCVIGLLGSIVIATTNWKQTTCPAVSIWGIAKKDNQIFALAKNKDVYIYDVDSGLWSISDDPAVKHLDFTLEYPYSIKHGEGEIHFEADGDEIHIQINGAFRQICAAAVQPKASPNADGPTVGTATLSPSS